MFSFEVVPGALAKDILDSSVLRVVELVEDAYLRHADGHTINPDSYFLRFPDKPDARIIALPAFADLPAAPVAGIKWIASFPSNVRRDVPRASAVLVLNDYETGYPTALLEAASISAARTAASAAVAARALAVSLPGNGEVAVFGAGVIARAVLRYLAAVGYRMDRLRVFDPHADSADHLVRWAEAELGLVAARVASPSEALTAQTVVTATTAATPHLSRPLEAGQVALNISLRDFAPSVVLGAQNYLDDIEHCMKANTSPHLAEQQVGHRDFVTGTIADLLRGRALPDPGRGVLVSPFGLGVLDLAVGQHVLLTAREQRSALEVPDFFGETRRW
ncbi:2,3-diaminopropionate biosynthesis protein SbnB [Actinoalloteichus sp. AHMU CJ021]|uniref:Ornithine cyclodeaminase n=1 Tax=Actinoalloteichus caeruleus DSM 43889 TaxID=1120930 RepID=A0ABT1JDI9_ACTCY|nr:2,3-diaminopropionate biosynthesis protein SbnB [Actinoalloteichus caeruleus]AUS81069.1 2,3-diaminopropionate biosynthesis protein SbnB [Actinoalloteichus sp. AHMU CJ021]MCP2330561.1 ornithine cyclodeaminase [Actinoalloteichus caeruleus DSM 43889]